MTNVSFSNLNNSQMSPEMEKRLQSQENFTAIDKEKLKQDTLELSSNAKTAVKENFIFKAMRGFGVEDPKKTLKALGMTLVTVVGFAVLGNKMSNKAADLGLKIDDVLSKDSFKWARNIGEGLGKAKNSVANFFTKNFKSAKDIADTFSDPAKKANPKNGFGIAQCAGPKYQFASAVIESLQGIFYGDAKKLANKLMDDDGFKAVFKSKGKLDKDIIREILSGDLLKDGVREKYPEVSDEILNKLFSEVDLIKQKNLNLMKKMVGEEKAQDMLDRIVRDKERNRVHFVNELLGNIRKNAGKDGKDASNKELLEFFKKIQKGEDGFDECKDINMIHGMDSWCTTNWIDKIGQGIFKNKWKNVSKANVGSALIKYGATSGKLADSTLGKFVQGFPTIFTESVSNYVCDMAFINAIVLPSFIELYKNVQDAPKEQKLSTLADEFVSGVGSFTIVMPTAGMLTYGLATLGNLEGKGVLSKILKPIGKFFGMGLKNYDPTQKVGLMTKLGRGTKGFVGGAFRLMFIMFILSSMIRKPIDAVVHKVFGKPYNKDEAEKLKQQEEQKKQIIPELGITQGELMERMQKNPQAIMKLQNDVKLAQEINKNPKLLLDLLDGKEIKPSTVNLNKGLVSPLNQKIVNNKMSHNALNNTNSEMNNVNNKNIVNNTSQNEVIDSATYIPSSAPVVKTTMMSNEQTQEYNNLMTKADKAIKRAEKYI